MSRRATLVALMISLVAACGVPSDDGAKPIDDDRVPYDLLEADAQAVVPGGGAPVELCLLDGERLASVERELPGKATPTDLVRALAVLTNAEAVRGLRTAMSSASDIDDVQVVDGTAIVDFDEGADQGFTSEPLATVAQIVCTLTARPGVRLVSFSIGDVPIQVPTADGTLTSDPVAPEDFAPLLPG